MQPDLYTKNFIPGRKAGLAHRWGSADWKLPPNAQGGGSHGAQPPASPIQVMMSDSGTKPQKRQVLICSTWESHDANSGVKHQLIRPVSNWWTK